MKTSRFLVACGVSVPAGLAAWLVASTTLGAPGAGAASLGSFPAEPAGHEAAGAGVEWFWGLNGPVSADEGSDLSVDTHGNVFLAGGHGGLDMDNDGVVDLESGATAYVGARNTLFMKIGRSRSDEPMKLRWVRSPRSPADRIQAKVAADGRGGVYVSGSFAESLAFEDGPTLEGAGGNDAFTARYDGEGSVIWARVFGGTGGGDAIYGLASDREANAYLVPLDDSGAEFRTRAQRAAVIVSYDPEGTVRWSRVFGAGVPLAFVVRVAPNGQVYVTGELEGTADFDDDGTVDLPAPKDRDGFVARFDTDGVFLGAWAVPSPGGLAFAPEGDVVLGGGMGGPMDQRYGPADFNGDGRPDIELKGGGPTGGWIARYSADGELRWVRSYALERPADMEVRGDQIVISGTYKGVRDLDEDGRAEPRLDVVDSSLESDLAIMILSAQDGRPLRVWTAPGPGNDWANAIAFLPNQPALLVTGAIQLTADFTGDGEHGEGWILCDNLGDLYVAQYRLPEGGERAEPPSEIRLDVRMGQHEGEVRANLTWSGARSDRIDVYRNGERIAEAGSDRCSAMWEGGR
jgi:hypothetical protein